MLFLLKYTKLSASHIYKCLIFCYLLEQQQIDICTYVYLCVFGGVAFCWGLLGWLFSSATFHFFYVYAGVNITPASQPPDNTLNNKANRQNTHTHKRMYSHLSGKEKITHNVTKNIHTHIQTYLYKHTTNRRTKPAELG